MSTDNSYFNLIHLHTDTIESLYNSVNHITKKIVPLIRNMRMRMNITVNREKGGERKLIKLLFRKTLVSTSLFVI